MPQPSQKNLRGQPELYDELKRCFSVALTPTGASRLDALARSFNLSRSELVEQVARGQIPLHLEG